MNREVIIEYVGEGLEGEAVCQIIKWMPKDIEDIRRFADAFDLAYARAAIGKVGNKKNPRFQLKHARFWKAMRELAYAVGQL